jgi:DNA-binding CsgD family transcriptional regulator
MFDPIAAVTATAPRAREMRPPAAVGPGGEMPLQAQWLAQMLDEIDYGMLLVADDGTVLHANHVARAELDGDHPLQMLGQQLRTRQPQDVAPLNEALRAARERGLRRLLRLGAPAAPVSVAVVPLGSALALLVFGKRRVCEALSAHWFAREHGLTPAEARVLAALCDGQPPRRIASAQGVAISTIRTQIGAIRAKTGAQSLRALVSQVAVLPPLVSALRGAALAMH